jgi:shikimate dehydrogenase
LKTAPRLSGGTRLVAIFGWPLTYTLSPAFQNAALRRHGADAVYVALPTENAAEFRRLASALMASPHFVGANVTNPYKLEACRLAGRLSPAARAIGAVNTLARVRGKWEGHNTDAAGFLAALQGAGVGLRRARVLLLGAGGSARAAAWAAGRAGAARVVVLARRRAQARDTAALAGRAGLSGELVAGSAALASLGADLVVNCLPGGELGGHYGKCLARRAKKGAVAMDLSYLPPETPFLAEASLRGWRGVSGLDMLVEQGREAFALWFGKKPDRAPLVQALRKI